MGGGGSKPTFVDPYPKQDSLEGLSMAKAQGCAECKLVIPAGVSSASVRLQRPKKEDKVYTFSPGTKILITPTLAFEIQFNGASVPVKSMTLYHPCPVRVENIQYDAVLCLNDPGLSEIDTKGLGGVLPGGFTAEQQTHVLMIPIKAENNPDGRAEFFSRFVPYMSALKDTKPDSNIYADLDVPVGKDWSLTTMFPVSLTKDGNPEVRVGYYSWQGGGTYESKFVDEGSQFRYKWVQSGQTPRYIMLDTAVPISAADLQTITSTLPPTPFRPPFPIHPIPELFVYKPCEKPKTESPVKESFENAECDPFGPEAKYPPSPISADAMFGFAMTILSLIGAVLVVWGVMKLADNPVFDKFKTFGEFLGKGLAKAFRGAATAIKKSQTQTQTQTVDTSRSSPDVQSP
jgi:hypothetical protein